MRTDFFLEAMNEIDDKYIEEVRSKTMKKKFNFKPMIAVAACALFALAAVPVANYFANASIGITSSTSGTIGTTESLTPVKKEYSALVYDYTDGIPGGKKDIDLNHKTIKKSPAPSDSITIDGVTYKGAYTSSWAVDFYNFDRDEYIYNDDNVEVRYTINANTGKLEAFMITRKNYDPNNAEEKKTYSEEECIEIAKEYIKQYVPNIEKYTLVSKNKTQAEIYHFKFREFIGDLRIGNDAFVNVNIYGEVVDIDYHTDIEDVEAFKESGYLETIDWDAVDEAIEARANEMLSYSEQFDSIEVINTEEHKTTKTLVKMADGSFALKCQVNVCMTYKDFPEYNVSDTVFMIIYLD